MQALQNNMEPQQGSGYYCQGPIFPLWKVGFQLQAKWKAAPYPTKEMYL